MVDTDIIRGMISPGLPTGERGEKLVPALLLMLLLLLLLFAIIYR